MSRKEYTHVQISLPEIEGMIAAGKTPREAEAYFGLRDIYVVKKLLNRERRKADRIAAEIMPGPKAAP